MKTYLNFIIVFYFHGVMLFGSNLNIKVKEVKSLRQLALNKVVEKIKKDPIGEYVRDIQKMDHSEPIVNMLHNYCMLSSMQQNPPLDDMEEKPLPINKFISI
jgi:hypothetical protein